MFSSPKFQLCTPLLRYISLLNGPPILSKLLGVYNISILCNYFYGFQKSTTRKVAFFWTGSEGGECRWRGGGAKEETITVVASAARGQSTPMSGLVPPTPFSSIALQPSMADVS